MDNTPAPEKRPRYVLSSYTTSNKEENIDWFFFEIKLNGKRFEIDVSISEFQNSPSRTEQARKALTTLRSDWDGTQDEGETSSLDGVPDHPQDSIGECCKFMVAPHLEQFERLAPLPAQGTILTLDYFFSSESYKCRLTAVDDEFMLGEIERRAPWPDSDLELSELGLEDNPESREWTNIFPTFTSNQVEVICGEWKDSYDLICVDSTAVIVDGQEFFFKPVHIPDHPQEKREIGAYEKIEKANFGPEVRTSRLYGVVVDENQQLKGLLFHRITIDEPLEYKVTSDTPEASRKRWAEQVETTVKALHKEGIVWGDAKPENVLVDDKGDAYVIDFGGGYTRGWVDREKAGTIEGDLEALEKILTFVATKGIEDGDSDSDD